MLAVVCRVYFTPQCIHMVGLFLLLRIIIRPNAFPALQYSGISAVTAGHGTDTVREFVTAGFKIR